MKKRYSEEQIIKAIKQHEAGAKVDDICRDMGITSGTFYNWRSKYAGLEVNEAKRLKVHFQFHLHLQKHQHLRIHVLPKSPHRPNR